MSITAIKMTGTGVRPVSLSGAGGTANGGGVFTVGADVIEGSSSPILVLMGVALVFSLC